ncbi:hypothetical protein [Nocardia abscessus]|uniref:hypothetical protein n=1 Tax=Nocardia abscessus TaxID=120957 RepID=UPI0024558235|nr:hypothetical protein [Nocardia abscessus]
MPPGLFLPRGVTLPWRWDGILDTRAQEIVSALEGITDPARILAEFGSRAGRSGSVRISALVSSAVIPDNLRAALGDEVAVEGGVPPDAESALDLTSPGIGLVDRLALAGPRTLRQQASTVSGTEIRATCLELARAADAQVRSAVSAVDGGLAHRAVRRRLLDALHAGWSIPASWWEEFRAADDMAAAALRARRVDVSHIPLGARLDVTGMDALRSLVFERRADELLLLLADNEPDRQTLRDALYTYGQIIEHPLFPAAAHGVADAGIARAVGYGAADVSPVSVGPAAPGAAPPSIAELLNGRAGSEGFGEQRRA